MLFKSHLTSGRPAAHTLIRPLFKKQLRSALRTPLTINRAPTPYAVETTSFSYFIEPVKYAFAGKGSK